MRRLFLFLGALCAAGLMPVFGQDVIPGNRAGAIPAPVPPLATDMTAPGKVVSADAPLSPGDTISISILEDNQPAWKTIITATGEAEISNLGSVKVSGVNAASAASLIRAHLLKNYYNKCTVEVRLLMKTAGYVRPDKVTVAGKVGRPGPQYFSSANPLKLSEAVIISGTSVYSDLKKVQLTRGGQNSYYNVDDITKGGRTDLDVQLKDGDQVFVRERGWVVTQ